MDQFVGTSCCCSSHHIVDLACPRSTFVTSELAVVAWQRTASTAVDSTVVASSSSVELTLQSSTFTAVVVAIASVAFATVGSTAAVAEPKPTVVGSSSFSVGLKCTAFYCFQCERGNTCCITL